MVLFTIEDVKGRIWVGTEEGVYCIEDNKAVLYNKNNKFISSRINNAVLDKKGNIWFGTRRNGIVKYDGKNSAYCRS